MGRAERFDRNWRGDFCISPKGLIVNKTAKVIITPTLVITFALVIALAAWAVSADWRAERKRKKGLESKCKEIGIPVELYLEYEKDSSLAMGEYIRILSIKNKDPEKIGFMRLLQEAKKVEEAEQAKIADDRARIREQEMAHSVISEEKLFSVTGFIFALILVSGVVAIALYALTLVIPSMVFSWTFVFITTALVVILLTIASYFR